MTDTEVIKLKKEIHHLREQNADLLSDLEEKNQKLGRMESEYLKMKNETLLVTKTKLMQHSEMVKLNVEKALESEKARINFLEKNYEEALQKIAYYEQEKINIENHHKELQLQNNQLKKQLQEFGQKTQTTDFIRDLRDKDENLMRKERDYQKMVMEWNQLCDKMEDILSENRLLKELANVPANFGINIEEIKLGDRLKIEDYKAKIRLLQREVDELETERAQLKHKLLFLSNALEIKEPPFNMLTTEQKKTVAEYAQSLYEGRDFILPERYELLKENSELKNKIEFLEKQISTMQLESNYRIYGVYNSGNNLTNSQREKLGGQNLSQGMPDSFKEVIDMLKKENEDLKAMLSKSLDKFSNFNEEFFKSQYVNQGMGMGINTTGNQSMGNINQNMPLQYTSLQMPAVPILDTKDIDNTGYAFSYKFNSKFKIDPNQIHSLFGIAKDDSDIESFKIESASLQSQLIEIMEILSRSQSSDTFLNENLEKLYNKLENIVSLQNELFERYVHEKKNYTTIIEENSKTNKNLLEELNDLKRKDKALEATISLLETKNLSQIESRAVEKMKENSILEVNYIKLLRKYESLLDEEAKMRKLAEEIEKNSTDKDIQLEGTIIKLKEWKQILTFYLKMLIKKLKKSVDKSEFEKVLEENKYLREKYNEMVLRDISITKQMSLIENLKIKIKEYEQNFFNSEEMRIDCEIELNHLKKRLQESDPNFYIQEKIFRKFYQKLNEYNMSFTEIKKVFDANNSGKISRSEFIIALKTMNMYTSFNESEVEQLLKSLNFDEDNNLDTSYFIRKLERVGVFDENEGQAGQGSSDEKILQEFIDGIKNSGVNLKSVFELFDSSGDGNISNEEFKFAMQQLNIKISDEMIGKIIFLITEGGSSGISMSMSMPVNQNLENTQKSFGDKSMINNTQNNFNKEIPTENSQMNNNSINYVQFCAMFDQRARYLNLKNKKNLQLKNNLKIDWKTNLLSTIVEGIRRNDLTFIEAFKFLDKDNSGYLNKDEFTFFLRRINVNFKEHEIEQLFKMLDKNGDAKIESDEFISTLKECEEKIQAFKNYTNTQGNSTNLNEIEESARFGGGNVPSIEGNKNLSSDNKLKHKYSLLVEKEKYYTYKINQMRTRLEEMEKINKDTSTQLEEYVRKHSEMMDKYFTASEDMQKFKSQFNLNGIKKEDISKIEQDNDNLLREVTVLRVGLNTFKDLYKSCSRQVHILTIKAQRNADEVDTYKKAVKDLQSESNQNALIGKLYYSLLISRWREASTIRKHEDFTQEFQTLREENFKCESENKNTLREITELQTALHEKIIENLRLEDEIQHVSQGFGSGSGLTHEQVEEFKQLMRDLSKEKTDLTEKYFNLRRENLRLQTEMDELRNKVDYSEALVNRIKYNSTDEYSRKLISVSEEISKLKLSEQILSRENFFFKENENHLNRLIEHLNKTVKTLEISNSEMEGKYRKMDETWRQRDEERQKKFFESMKKINLISSGSGNISQSLISAVNNVNPLYIKSQLNNNGNNNSPSLVKISEYENKLKELNDIIQLKNNEILHLSNLNKENEDLLKEYSNNLNVNFTTQNNPLLSQKNLDLIKNDETQLVAQTAHKTIKTLQDLLDSKNSEIRKKDDTIEKLKNESIKNKEHHLNIISKLQEQIQLDHDSTMKKLKNVLDTVNQNMLVKISKSQLSVMTLADIESLIEEKDNAIRTLAVELKHTKEENEISYLKISDLNKRINELSFNINEKKFMSGIQSQNEEVDHLKRIIKEKTELIEEEKLRIKKISEEFNRKLQDRTLIEEQMFKSSVHIPERLLENAQNNEMYAKIQSLRNKNKKLVAEIDKLNKSVEEYKKQIDDFNKNTEKIKNENKMFLQTQVKDTKTISRLKKEKEELCLEREKLKEKVEQLQKLIDNMNMSKDKEEKMQNSQISQNKIGAMKRAPSASRKSIVQVKEDKNANLIKDQKDLEREKLLKEFKDIKSDLIKESQINITQKEVNEKKPVSNIEEPLLNTQQTLSSPVEADDVLKRLVFFCLKKNINMSRHLQRYDLTKLGKLTKVDFTKAIDELKLGFIDNDIYRLLQCVNTVDEYLEIKQFISKMIEKDRNYELLIKENGKLLLLQYF
jgi:Ca2+-binding EF-hand superfamily protein